MKATTRLSAAEVAAVVRDLPALPEIVTSLVDAIGRETVSIDQLTARLSRDQGLSAKVLRLANSSFYGFQGRVASVRKALVVLGVSALRSVVTVAGIVGSFPTLPRDHPIAGIWRHAFATASCARAIAVTQRLDAEAAFTAGLIHDLGRLVLVMHCSHAYDPVLRTGPSHGRCLAEVERDLLGVDHAEVGAALALRWRLPDEVAIAVRDHHQPLPGDIVSLADVVQVADAIVHALDAEAGVDECVPLLESPAWDRLALSRDRLCALLDLAETAWREADTLSE